VKRSIQAGKAGIFAFLAVVFALLGASVPVHFRTLAPSVLVEAGRGTESLGAFIGDHLDAGKPGLPILLLNVLPDGESKSRYDDRIRELLERHPQYRFSGGPDPYFEAFLEMLGPADPRVDAADPISLLLPAVNRRHLLGFLEHSSSATVRAILDTRQLTTTTRFMPVASPAGHPLDATVLLTALLAQGNHFEPSLARIWKSLAEESVASGGAAVDRLEALYLAVLSLGKRMNWSQLTELIGRIEDPESLVSCAVVARTEKDRWPLFYSLILLSDSPPGVIGYLRKFPDDGWKNLAFALHANRGAVDELTQMEKPLYEPPPIVRALDRFVTPVRREPILEFTLRHRVAAILLKIAAFLFAGYSLACFLSALRTCFFRAPRVSLWHPVVIFETALVASFAALSLWVVMEPALFQGGPEAKARLRLDFSAGNNLESLKSQNMETAMLDQITILIIVLFFLLQLIIYAIGVIKLAEVKKEPASPALKIKLLENEENLFDLGLFVGLGGTVASLILLAMDVVQASLIAAYSSTLFGIIFVAVLKVFNLRPFRRRLILEVEQISHEQVAAAHN